MKNPKLLSIVITTIMLCLLTLYIANKTSSPYALQKSTDLSLGMTIWIDDQVGFFNSVSQKQDFVAAQYPYLKKDVLTNATTKNKFLIFSNSHYENMEEMFLEGTKKGAVLFIYDPNTEIDLSPVKTNISQTQIIETLSIARRYAKKYKVALGYVPNQQQLDDNETFYLNYADTVLIKTDNYQNEEKFGEVVQEIINPIMKKSHNVYLIAQVSVHPPEKPNIDPMEVVQQIESIKSFVDGIHVYYRPSKETQFMYPKLLSIFEQYRPNKKSESPAINNQNNKTEKSDVTDANTSPQRRINEN